MNQPESTIRRPLSPAVEIGLVVLTVLALIGIVPTLASAYDGHDEAVFTQTVSAPSGSLRIANGTMGSASNASDEFMFTVTLASQNVNGTYGDLTFENGTATVRLAGGQSATATGLPVFMPYTVTEASNDYTCSFEHATGTIDAGTTAIATFTNLKTSNAD